VGTSKTKSGGSVSAGVSIVRFVLRPQNRSVVLTLAVVIVAVAGAVYGWWRWGEAALRSSEYQISDAQISVTPQPAWIRADVRQETLRALSSIELDLLDRGLVDKIAHAFALHPWVAKVLRVEKQNPARIIVDVEYRRPVLAVKLDVQGEEGLLLVDGNGVLLRSSDFSPAQAKDYLRITASGEAPTGVYGTPWASERITGAARVAEALADRWQKLGLYWISASRPTNRAFVYELRDQENKLRVIWGAAPGNEAADEATAEAKIAALERYLADKDPPAPGGSPVVVDLRLLAAGSGKTAATHEPQQRPASEQAAR